MCTQSGELCYRQVHIRTTWGLFQDSPIQDQWHQNIWGWDEGRGILINLSGESSQLRSTAPQAGSGFTELRSHSQYPHPQRGVFFFLLLHWLRYYTCWLIFFSLSPFSTPHHHYQKVTQRGISVSCRLHWRFWTKDFRIWKTHLRNLKLNIRHAYASKFLATLISV